MSANDPYTFEELNDRVARVVAALQDGQGVINTELAIDALAFVAAMLFDLDPHHLLPGHLRKAAEQHGEVVHRYARFLRKHFDETGVHFGEQIGGEVMLTGDLPQGHARH